MAKPGILSRGPCDPHQRAAPEMEALGGASAVDGNLEVIGAADQRADVAVGRLRIRRNHARHRVRADADLEPAVGNCKLVEAPAIDVRDQIAEPIDAKYLTVDAIGGDLGLRNIELVNRARRSPECRQLDALRE